MQSCLVIDNGSGMIKAGWAQETYPKLVFDSLVSKSTKCKANQQPGCFVGIDNSRSKTPFEEGLLVNADLMEKIFDHVFHFSGVQKFGLERVVMTEPICNPTPCRDLLAELLFEGYGVNELSLGIDAAFSLYRNKASLDFSGSILSISHSCTHTLPYINGVPQFQQCNRLNVGCTSLVKFMQHLIQTKYPDFPHILTQHDYKSFIQNHCYFAEYYSAELVELLNQDDQVIQYPLTDHINSSVSERVKLTQEEQDKLEFDRNAFIQSIVKERDEKRKLININDSKSSGSNLRKKSETQNRMRQMASLLEEEAGDFDFISNGSDKKRQRKKNLKLNKVDENFGDAEEDWIVYNQLSKEPKPEAQDEAVLARLARLDRLLAEYDPYRIFQKPKQVLLNRLAYGSDPLNLMSPDEIHQRRHQIRLNLERIRVPEVFFAPHMLGVDMRGIDELLVGTKTVFCTGGGCLLPNLKTRLRTVLQPEVSTETPVQVLLAQDPIIDTWKGMTKASSSGLLIGCQRNEYMETGTCFKAHPWSNYR